MEQFALELFSGAFAIIVGGIVGFVIVNRFMVGKPKNLDPPKSVHQKYRRED